MLVTHASAGIANPVQPRTLLVDFIAKVRELDNLASDAEAALAVLTQKANSWAEALQALGIDESAIIRRIEQLSSYLVQAQDRLAPILLTLADRPEPKNLSLSYSDSEPIEVGALALALSAEADLNLTVKNQLPAQTSADWGTVANGDALQIFTAHGMLGVGGTANASGGSLSFGAKASATATLFYQYAASTPVVVALMQSSRTLALPWDLDKVADSLSPMSGDGRWLGLRRTQLIGTGEFNLAGGATIGHSVIGGNTVGIKADLGATVDFSIKRSGTFKIALEKNAAGNLNVSVDRATGSESGGSISLGADINITGLDARARELADRFLPDSSGVIEKLERWKRPGDLVLAKFQDSLDGDVEEQLGRLLTGQTDAAKASKVGQTRLAELIKSELNERLPFWGTDNSQDLARSALAKISERLDLEGRLANLLAEKLQAKLVDWIDELKKELEDEIAEWVDKAGNKLKDFLQPLEEVGEDVNELLEKVNQTASALISPVLEQLKRYEAIRQKIHKALDKAAKLRITLAFAASINRSKGDEAVLSFEILNLSQSVKSAYRALLLGRLDQGWPDFQQALTDGDISNVSGRFKSWLKRERSIGLSLQIGDFGLGMSRVKVEDINVEVGTDGRVTVAALAISQEASSELAYASRTASLLGAYDIVAASFDRDAFPTPLSVSLGYSDEHMRGKELRQLLTSLESPRGGRPLLRQGATADALAKYDELTAGERSGNARFDLSLPVSIEDFRHLLLVSEETIKSTAAELLIDALFDERDQEAVDFVADHYRDGVTRAELFELMQSGPTRVHVSRIRGTAISASFNPVPRVVRRLRAIAEDVEQLLEAVSGVRQIAELQGTLANIDASELGENETPLDKSAELRAELDRIAKDVNDGLAHWLRPRGPISGLFTEKIPARTVAFLQLLALLGKENTVAMPVVRVLDVPDGEFAVV